MTTEVKQEFNGTVEGGVARRDIVNHTTVVHMPERRPESQLQTEFAQRTGIWCPKPAREWLEHLMEDHHFTVRELARAWKAGSIGWNADKDAKRIVTPWIEAAFAYGMAGIMSIYFFVLAAELVFGASSEKKWAMALFYGIGLVYVGMCWMLNRFMLWPRRVAMRIKRIEILKDGEA